MSLPGVCPECGLRADLVVFAGATETNRAIAAGLDIPSSLGPRVLRYLRLFSPEKKVLAANKTARLLTELAQAINSAQVERKGQSWAAPLPVWEAGLDTLLGNPPDRLPLQSHGYLFEVVASLAARAAGQAERQREHHAQSGTREPARPLSANQEINDMINDLRALQTLERHNPGVHAEQIARLQAAIHTRQHPQHQEAGHD